MGFGTAFSNAEAFLSRNRTVPLGGGIVGGSRTDMSPTSSSRSTDPFLNNAFIVSVITALMGGIGGVQTKPSGIFSSDRKALLWKLGDVTPTLTNGTAEGESASEKLVAKFETPGGTASGGSIAVRFTAGGSVLSDIGLEFVPEPGFEQSRASIGDLVMKIVSGKYGATS